MADKSTIISIVPFELREEKPGLNPGFYTIPAAQEGDIASLVVSAATGVMYIGEDRGVVNVPVPSSRLAASICNDYQSAKLGYMPGEREPGLFWVDGEYKDKKVILATFKDKIDHARLLRRNWLVYLVEVADDQWNQYHTHKSISDEMRNACDFLSLERDWNVKGAADSVDKCPACTSIVPAAALVCPVCRTIIKPKEYKEKNFQVA